MIPLWLWILIAVLGFLALIVLALCLVRVRLRIVSDNGLALSLCVLFLRFRLLGGEKKAPETKPCPNPERLLRREMRRERRRQKRAERKKRRAARTKTVPAEPQTPLGIGDRVGVVTALVKHFYEKTNGHIGVRIKRLHISIGTDDAAKTAILYGAVSQSVATLLELVNSGYTPVKYKDGAVAVIPDYLSGKSEAHIDLSVSVAPMRALMILLGLLDAHRTESSRAKKKAQSRMAKRQSKQEQNT